MIDVDSMMEHSIKTDCYACYNLNLGERMKSSSGGIYPLLARTTISNGGIVFAVCYDDNLDVVHKKITSLSEIPASQGSKYVSSKLGDTLKAIVDAAKDGQVLFVGTPCQCAGLISVLEASKVNRENVTIVDCVCHGVQSRVAWNLYRQSLVRSNKTLQSVYMRDKSSGWSKGNYSWMETMTDGRTIITPRREVPFMKGMLANIYLRSSCYNCCFKGVERRTDFTLGDYWGVWNHDPDMDDDRGTSLLLVHSDKGRKILKGLEGQFKFKLIDADDAIQGNSCIVRSTPCSNKREEFFRRIEKDEDFIAVVDDLTKESLFIRSKRTMKRIVKKLSGGGISNPYTLNPSVGVAA